MNERGYASFRLIAGVAVFAGLVAFVPFLLLSRQQTERTKDLLGTGEVPGAVDPGSSIGRANDISAQATLHSAIRSAEVYLAERGAFDGFDPQAASAYDPSISYTTAPASPGVVSIRGLTSSTVVLVTAVDGGGYVCVAATYDVVSFGRSDARTPEQCAGGW